MSITTLYAMTLHFDSSKAILTNTKQLQDLMKEFDSQYTLTKEIQVESNDVEQEIKEKSKQVTELLFLANGEEETTLEYYQRYNTFMDFRYSTPVQSDDDEFLNSYTYTNLSQTFQAINLRDCRYSILGEIYVTAVDDKSFISTILVPNVSMMNIDENNPLYKEEMNVDITLYYEWQKIDGEYKLFYIFEEAFDESSINVYYQNIETLESKNTTNIIDSFRGSDNFSSIYNYDQLDHVSKNTFQKLLTRTIDSVVLLNSYYNNELITTAHGFFLKEGILITTWSFIKSSLENAQYIAIRDYQGNYYDLDGIITINPNTDIALLKLKEEKGNPVTISPTNAQLEDPIFTVNSKTGVGFSLQSGIALRMRGYVRTIIPMRASDAGSPLFNLDGAVVGMNVPVSIDSNVSFSLPVELIEEAYDNIKQKDFDTIVSVPFDDLKERYYRYTKDTQEQEVNTIPDKIWKKYAAIGDIEKTIPLKLIKGSYQDGVVSLRYKNETPEYVSNMQYASAFQAKLLEDGYQEVSNEDNRYVYENKKYKVIVMSQFQYLLIVMVKL